MPQGYVPGALLSVMTYPMEHLSYCYWILADISFVATREIQNIYTQASLLMKNYTESQAS